LGDYYHLPHRKLFKVDPKFVHVIYKEQYEKYGSRRDPEAPKCG